MIYILFIILLVIAIIIYLLNKRNILLPSFITTVVFIIGTMVYIFCYKKYGYDISLKTMLVIIASILSIFAGEVFCKFGKYQFKFTSKTYKKNAIGSENIIFSMAEINIPYKITFIFIIVEIIAAVRRAYSLIQIGKEIGFTGDVRMLISSTRGVLTNSIYTIDTLTQFFCSIAAAIAYLFFYYFLREKIIFKKNHYLYLCVVLIYFIMQIFSTGRQGFIEIIIIAFVESVLITYNSKMRKNSIFKSGDNIKYAIFSLLCIIVIFYFYGMYFRHSSNSLIDSLGEYVAAPLFGLNDFLNNRWEKNNYLGQYIFKNYYYYLNKFGSNYNLVSDHLPFFNCAKTSSNVYTGLVLPIQDFGVGGMIITRFFIGIIYSELLYQIKHCLSKSNQWHIFKSVLFSYMMVAVAYSSIADKYKEFFTVTSFPLLILSLAIINKVCISIQKFE